MFSESSGPLRLVVSGVFTITGRGTVAVGIAEQGRVQPGDRVEVIHGATRTITTCHGLETFILWDSGCDLREIGPCGILCGHRAGFGFAGHTLPVGLLEDVQSLLKTTFG